MPVTGETWTMRLWRSATTPRVLPACDVPCFALARWGTLVVARED